MEKSSQPTTKLSVNDFFDALIERRWFTRKRLLQANPGSELHLAWSMADELATLAVATEPLPRGQLSKRHKLERGAALAELRGDYKSAILFLLSGLSRPKAKVGRPTTIESRGVFLRMVEDYREQLRIKGRRVTDKAAIELMLKDSGCKHRSEISRMQKQISATRRQQGKPLRRRKSGKPTRNRPIYRSY